MKHSHFISPSRYCIAMLAGGALVIADYATAAEQPPLGPIGTTAAYILDSASAPRETTARRLVISLGPVETHGSGTFQWLNLDATKVNGDEFRVSVLAKAYPNRLLNTAATNLARYVLQEGNAQPKEFVHRVTGEPVLPTTGAWKFLWPRAESGDFQNGVSATRVAWLGHYYKLESSERIANNHALPTPRRIELLPDVLVGVPSNTRTKDDTRRYDESEYEMIRLTRENYAEMIRAGMNCFRVDAEQAGWLADEPVFLWGIGGKDVPYPECLFRSTWIGPALFLDEPAVHTRDYSVRPRMAKDPSLRKSISPQFMFQQFTNVFHEAVSGTPWSLIKNLRERADVDLGTLNFPQRNLYSWETMVATAAWQLTAGPEVGPRAMVFEPPGRLGSRRTLPEMNMAYGCQLSPEYPANLAGVIYGFLRGAARPNDKDWGVSIYGAVDRADAPWLLTHAYDLGATHFFFWDNYQMACVPYGEYLSHTRHLQAHVQSRPKRDLARLKRAAETLILLPPGYDLGHTHTGRGNLWGLGELNLERKNREGIRYRQVMGNFFTEIERCLRLGFAFDLRWDLDGLPLDGYREIVRVREDGRVEITADGKRTIRKGPRVPERPSGKPPQLAVELSGIEGELPRTITARAQVEEGSAAVYYTTGTDRQGVYQNAMVLWELYGPEEEDYRTLPGHVIQTATPDRASHVETRFTLSQPGHYRLRAATTDLAGRSTVVWKGFNAGK
ncbi:MAG: hypothetical protein HOP33_00925 [Verrucomicrobia bacterium]|nr:hypothetical protein [Verrucomicrobiota bacterium]